MDAGVALFIGVLVTLVTVLGIIIKWSAEDREEAQYIRRYGALRTKRKLNRYVDTERSPDQHNLG